jgi:hypothetical protein
MCKCERGTHAINAINAGMCRRDACTTMIFGLFCGAAVSAARLIEQYCRLGASKELQLFESTG